jgi:hypothetical protein
LRNNHFIYRHFLMTCRFVLDFIVPPNIGVGFYEEPMRLLGSFMFTNSDRPIIGSVERAHLLACGSYQQTKVPVPGFTGPE